MAGEEQRRLASDRLEAARARLAALEREGGNARQVRQAERHVNYWLEQLSRRTR